MPNERTSIEIIAPTSDDAVARGLDELGLGPDDVDVEVLDAGSSGILGLGARDARVRLTVRPSPSPEPEPEADDHAARVARETVLELLDRMRIQARVSARWGEPEEPGDMPPLYVDIEGDDLGALIGHRGETLNALQYIARLIISKELGDTVNLVVDVEGYKERRAQQLTALARRMAEQAIQRRRTVSLEPMPANERRIVHLALRDHPEVFTESVGEGHSRKVTIVPKGQTAPPTTRKRS